ncbi:MAG TPA: rhodanese-like domain-containing protein [Gaiellaceae bacterium]|nr:rhodanese-like domain-containing protein [Gaiellaceae bacterium]
MIEQVLAQARSRIARYTPAEAAAADGVLLVDLRSRDERERDGIIPGSVHVPRSVLEWRCDPDSSSANPVVADRSLRLVLVCAHGYSSSLAAASLADLGFESPGDLAGGFEAWREAGLPVAPAPLPADGLPGMGGPEA